MRERNGVTLTIGHEDITHIPKAVSRLMSLVWFGFSRSELQGKLDINHNLAAHLRYGLVDASAFLDTDSCRFTASENLAYSGNAVNVSFFGRILFDRVGMAFSVGCLPGEKQ